MEVSAPRPRAPDSRGPADLLAGACGAGGAQVSSRARAALAPRRRNVLKPQFHCVLTQWMSSFIALRSAPLRSGERMAVMAVHGWVSGATVKHIRAPDPRRPGSASAEA